MLPLLLFVVRHLPQNLHFPPLMFTNLAHKRTHFTDSRIPATKLLHAPAEPLNQQREPFQKLLMLMNPMSCRFDGLRTPRSPKRGMPISDS